MTQSIPRSEERVTLYTDHADASSATEHTEARADVQVQEQDPGLKEVSVEHSNILQPDVLLAVLSFPSDSTESNRYAEEETAIRGSIGA